MARSESFSRWWRSESADGFELPLSDSEEAHVLAVDDSLADRRVIERLLKISSCRVTAVDSGRRALQVLGLDDEKSPVDFHSLKVDMIITDYCMPGMTGYELLKKVKESSALREIPVVIMSSENVLARIDRCLEEGAEDYIVKPVKLSDVKRLKDYMTRGVWLKSGKGNNHERELHESSGRLYQSPPSDTLSLSESSSSPAPSSPLSVSSFSQPLSPLMDPPAPYSSLFLGIPHRTAQNE